MQDVLPFSDDRVPCIIIDNDEHFVSIEEQGQNLVFYIEVLTDITDNRDRDWPEADGFRLAFDYNLNFWVTSYIDTIYFKDYGSIDNYCATTLAAQGSTANPNDYNLQAEFKSFFISTNRNPQKHVIWQVSIPKREISSKTRAHFVLKIIDSDHGIENMVATYPSDNKFADQLAFSFNKVLTVEW